MEAERRKRGREPETTEKSEYDRLVKKLDVEKRDVDGCCGRGGGGRGEGEEEEEEEEEEEGRGVFDFPWLKREGEGGGGGGVMSEEEWKVTAAAEEEDTFLGTLGRCCCEREEVEIERGLPFLEEDNSTSSLSLVVEELEDGVSLEEAWDRDGM